MQPTEGAVGPVTQLLRPQESWRTRNLSVKETCGLSKKSIIGYLYGTKFPRQEYKDVYLPEGIGKRIGHAQPGKIEGPTGVFSLQLVYEGRITIDKLKAEYERFNLKKQFKKLKLTQEQVNKFRREAVARGNGVVIAAA